MPKAPKTKQPKATGRVRGSNGQFEKVPASRVQRGGKKSGSQRRGARTPTPVTYTAPDGEVVEEEGEKEEMVVMTKEKWDEIQRRWGNREMELKDRIISLKLKREALRDELEEQVEAKEELEEERDELQEKLSELEDVEEENDELKKERDDLREQVDELRRLKKLVRRGLVVENKEMEEELLSKAVEIGTLEARIEALGSVREENDLLRDSLQRTQALSNHLSWELSQYRAAGPVWYPYPVYHRQ